MWFRNARPYKLPGRLGIDASELSQRLSRRPFVPCRPSQPTSSGWVAALSDDATDFVQVRGLLVGAIAARRAFVTGLGHS